MENRKNIITKINHERLEIEGERAFMPLATYLREERSLTGTKVVCAEGDCGACTVLLARDTGPDGKLLFKSINSCILPLYLIDGAHVITIEGLKLGEERLHPVQESMVEHHGAQCGYCTPGVICAMVGLAEDCLIEEKVVTEKKAKNFLTGNLCRCTGYRPILNAAVHLDLTKVERLADRYHDESWIKEMNEIKNNSLTIKFNNKGLYLPVTFHEAIEAKALDPELRIIAGSTDLGVVVNKGRMKTPKAMALYHINELRNISHDEHMISVGSSVTLTEFENYILKFVPELSNMLHIFASPQIKNRATLVGNVVNGSPIADTIPFLMASEAQVELCSKRGTRLLKLSDFYLGYKKIAMAEDEIVRSIKIPRLKKNEIIRLYKVSMRKDLDISAVTFAGIVGLDKNIIKDARFAMGGVAATVVRLGDIENKLKGKEFVKEEFINAAADLSKIITPLSDLRASKEYRMKLAENFFLKFFNEASTGVVT